MIDVTQVLTVAGIDSSGGAGANADLKTFHNQCVYGASVITGLTAQNTLGVQNILPTPTNFISDQFKSVLSDLDIRALKTGALFDAD
ncbi:MAG: bifunctional hydroxymethylpyrimidine kinase/phosphomethylpyrimidine kinase, partial [Weissella confusa]|nr:bifunctional hydroxymethylpyrimidine kinase/phosphomethylpyrimidine kinase [Weissella confusa]